MDKYLFQYCQKLVVFSRNHKQILLCKRKGEQDYDGVYSFIGGKMEKTDTSLLASIIREKNEEIGRDAELLLYPLFSHVVTFQKKDGNVILLPHYYSIYSKGEILLSEEYSAYQWVNITELKTFSPMVENVPEMVKLMLGLKTIIKQKDLIGI